MSSSIFSFSGNVRRFIQRAGIDDTMEITQDNCTESSEPYILVTGTIDLEKCHNPFNLLEVNHAQLAVAASGNRNWGQNFAKAGRTTQRKYVPLLMKFEVQGTNNDVIEFKDKVISMKTMDEKKYNHIELNNEVTKRKDNGFST